MVGEVAGSVSERAFMAALLAGKAHLADPVEKHLSPTLTRVGTGEPVSAAHQILETEDAFLVISDRKPVGVLTRADLLGSLVD